MKVCIVTFVIVLVFNFNFLMIMIMNFNCSICLYVFMLFVIFLIFFGTSFLSLFNFALINSPQSLFEFSALLGNLLMNFLFIVLIEYLFNILIQLHLNQIGSHFLYTTNINCNWFLSIFKLNLFLTILNYAVNVE